MEYSNYILRLLNLKALFCIKTTGQYLAVTSNGQESRKTTQLLHPTMAA
jgi:hypothetical protein